MRNLRQQVAQPQPNPITIYIYGLVDPRTDCVRYVGQTKSPHVRYTRHCSYANRKRITECTIWITDLIVNGLRPRMTILESATIEECNAAEKRWIAYFSSIPNYPKLTNSLTGGGYYTRQSVPRGRRTKETMKRGVHRHLIEQPIDQSYKIIALTYGMNANVSSSSYDFLSQWNWIAVQPNKKGGWYAARRDSSTGRNRTIFMHDVLLPNASKVDHISGNTLDNRLENLRPATAAQNAHNRKIPSTNKSGYKGVSWHTRTQNWVAKIYFRNEQFHLGMFTDPVAGARCYDRKAIELFGEFARTNFPVSEYANEQLVIESSKISRRTGLKKRNSSSQFTGVCYVKREQRWLTTIWYLGKQRRLGTFINEVDAARAYDRFVIENGIVDARTNFSIADYD